MNIVSFLERKANWSLQTYGPGTRTKGVCAHIRKELEEIEAAPLDLEEWIDVFMLATDGYWRAWVELNPNRAENMEEMAKDFLAGIAVKDDKNRLRKWPKPISQDIPVEHDRSAE